MKRGYGLGPVYALPISMAICLLFTPNILPRSTSAFSLTFSSLLRTAKIRYVLSKASLSKYLRPWVSCLSLLNRYYLYVRLIIFPRLPLGSWPLVVMYLDRRFRKTIIFFEWKQAPKLESFLVISKSPQYMM